MYKNFANTVFIGKTVDYLPTCHSTNSVAATLVKENKALNGQIVITDEQTHGKGQVGRSWEASPGKNLTFSIVIFHERFRVKDQFDLNMVFSLGIFDFLSQTVKTKVEIKWPNDVFCDGKKMCGILIANTVLSGNITDSVVGIGLNINQKSFNNAPGATSMKMLTGREYEVRTIFEGLVPCIERRYLAYMEHGIQAVKFHYIDNLYRRGEKHFFERVENGNIFEGEIIGVAPTGKLSVNVGNRMEYYDFNTIRFVE